MSGWCGNFQKRWCMWRQTLWLAHNDKSSSFDSNRLHTTLLVLLGRRKVAICKSCLALGNDLTEATDNIFCLLKGYEIFSPSAPSPVCFFSLSKLWLYFRKQSIWLTDVATEGREINKYVQRSIQMPQKYGAMLTSWYISTVCVCVCAQARVCVCVCVCVCEIFMV